MHINYEAPNKYIWDIPIFNEDGTVTDRVLTGLENVLSAYVDIAESASVHLDQNKENYHVEQVMIVGSGSQRNRVDSDLDLMLISPDLDDRDCSMAKMILSAIYFNDKPKTEAIDVFVRREDKFPSRASTDITEQVIEILDNYNQRLYE
ncbi:hypothetical protein KY321_02420 [Candidatus Woesearchaeota archaeon]|nr:hypothetical protein [Candidatus Woesearchaeota archaeon]